MRTVIQALQVKSRKWIFGKDQEPERIAQSDGIHYLQIPRCRQVKLLKCLASRKVKLVWRNAAREDYKNFPTVGCNTRERFQKFHLYFNVLGKYINSYLVHILARRSLRMFISQIKLYSVNSCYRIDFYFSIYLIYGDCGEKLSTGTISCQIFYLLINAVA